MKYNIPGNLRAGSQWKIFATTLFSRTLQKFLTRKLKLVYSNSSDLLTSLNALARDRSSAWPQGFDSLRSRVHGAPQSRQTWTVNSRSPSPAKVKQKSGIISPLPITTLYRYTDSLLCNKSTIIFIFRNTKTIHYTQYAVFYESINKS